MAGTSRRSWWRVARRVVAVVCFLLLLSTVTAWCVAEFRLDIGEYRWGRYKQTTSPSGSAEWSYEAVTGGVNNVTGSIAIYRAVYTSYAPTKKELSDWDSWGGWQFLHAARGSRSGLPGTYWKAWDDWSLLGLRAVKASRQGTDTIELDVPHWMLASVLAIVTSALTLPDVRRARLERRRRRGGCLTCGYERGGLDPSAPCPECNSPGSTRA